MVVLTFNVPSYWYIIIGTITGLSMYTMTGLAHRGNNHKWYHEIPMILPCLIGGAIWPITIGGISCMAWL